MKKLIIAAAFLAVTAAIVFTLLGNKQKMAEMARIERPTAFPVSVAAVERQKISDTLSQVGEIVSERDVAVIAETQGKITALYCEVGSFVTAGQALLKIDDELPKAAFLAAQTNYHKAKKDLDRFAVLHREEVISDSQYETARLAYQAAEAEYTVARRQYRNAVITAPLSGLVAERPVSVGVTVTPGTVIANIVDLNALKVKTNLAEQDAFRLKAGDPVVIETDVYPGIKFAGTVKSIGAKGDEAHTFTVETRLIPQKDHPLKAGIFGRVTFDRINPAEALTIPREALIGGMRQPQVYSVTDGIAHLRAVTVAREIDSRVVISRGLRAGELVVVSGQENLEDQTRVALK